MSESVLAQVLELAGDRNVSWSGEEMATMRQAVWNIVEHWDHAADHARADFEMRHGDEPGAHKALADSDASLIEYRRAFSSARAATSVFRCMEPVSLHAATLAYYEAYHATQKADELRLLGESILSM